MGRGVHEKTKIKKDIKYAAKAATAEKLAAEEIELKFYFKNWQKKILKGLAEKLSIEELLKVGIFLGTTYATYTVLIKSSDLLTKADDLLQNIDAAGNVISDLQWFNWMNPVYILGRTWDIINSTNQTVTEAPTEPFPKTFNPIIFSVSVLISYMLVYQPQVIVGLIEAVSGGLVGVGKFLLAA